MQGHPHSPQGVWVYYLLWSYEDYYAYLARLIANIGIGRGGVVSPRLTKAMILFEEVYKKVPHVTIYLLVNVKGSGIN